MSLHVGFKCSMSLLLRIRPLLAGMMQEVLVEKHLSCRGAGLGGRVGCRRVGVHQRDGAPLTAVAWVGNAQGSRCGHELSMAGAWWPADGGASL